VLPFHTVTNLLDLPNSRTLVLDANSTALTSRIGSHSGDMGVREKCKEAAGVAFAVGEML
jgi:hypothetical protein